jgi:hypothetical protein
LRKTQNAKLIYDQKKFVGVDFGIAYCYEHEQGCADIQNAFGVDRSRLGIDGFRMTKYPDEDCMLEVTRFADKMQHYVGLYFDTKNTNLKMNNMVQYYLPRPTTTNEDEICAAWDYESFGLVVHQSNSRIIDELMRAIRNDDLIIKMGSGVDDGEGGMCLLIASRVPQKIQEELLKNDRDIQKLYEAATQSGVAEYLQKHRKTYYSLKPAWVPQGFETERGKMKTKYAVMFFLNPCEQYKYNCGWYSVEELKEWAKDKGPVCKDNMTIETAVATLKDAALLEKAVMSMVKEIKDKLLRDVKSAAAPFRVESENGNDDSESQYPKSYYSPADQAAAVEKKLRTAYTSTDLLSRLDIMIRDKSIRLDANLIPLNHETLTILKEYLASTL